jgi:glycosyltransferase involved in cell wall biosynthesis
VPTRVSGCPIDWTLLHRREPRAHPSAAQAVTLGFVGRIHEEKGLALLAAALALVVRTPGLPAWRLVLCGPVDTARGGSGPGFRSALEQRFDSSLPAGTVTFLEPQFDDDALARVYRSIDIFCYPSLAERGETFGVAVAEAMAAGAVPVVSALACFADFVRDGVEGLVFDHRAEQPEAKLADCLVRLLRDAALRDRLAAAANTTARRYDRSVYAEELLADFAQLTGPAATASSSP